MIRGKGVGGDNHAYSWLRNFRHSLCADRQEQGMKQESTVRIEIKSKTSIPKELSTFQCASLDDFVIVYNAERHSLQQILDRIREMAQEIKRLKELAGE
jgi:hypothetical protein